MAVVSLPWLKFFWSWVSVINLVRLQYILFMKTAKFIFCVFSIIWKATPWYFTNKVSSSGSSSKELIIWEKINSVEIELNLLNSWSNKSFLAYTLPFISTSYTSNCDFPINLSFGFFCAWPLSKGLLSEPNYFCKLLNWFLKISTLP